MSSKFVIKCGNFAVLTDLHALPLGSQQDTSWFSQELKEEVSALIREAVDQRVKQFVESRRQQQQKGPQAKQRRELTPASPLCVKGPSFRLAAYFMKRHVNLRCISRKPHGELRVFPERFVVCVSRPGDAAAALGGGNVTRPMEEQGGQSRSGYFSGPGETLEPLNNSAITKRTALQKIAKQASAQAEPSHAEPPSQSRGEPEALDPSDLRSVAEQGGGLPPRCPPEVSGRGGVPGGAASSGGASLEGGEGETLAPLSPSKPRNEHLGTTSREVAANPQKQQERSGPTTSAGPQAQPCVGAADGSGTGSKKRRGLRQEGLVTRDAKRLCLGGPSEPPSSAPGPSPCTPPPPPKHARESCALGAGLAAHGKQGGRLPLRVSNTEQTNPSRLAASLRGLSVKPISSGSSIGSRPAAKEGEGEGGQSTARTSRLRRPKKS